MRVALDESMTTKKVRAPVAVYTPCCFNTMLLSGLRFPHKSWSILRERAKKKRISKACLPLWDWMRVQLLTDYVGNLGHRISHLPGPPQSAALTKKRVLLFKQLIPPLVVDLATTIPHPPPSSHPYKMPMPLSQSEKLRADL